MRRFGWLSERGEQLFKFASERGRYQKGRGVPLEKEGSNPGGNYGDIRPVKIFHWNQKPITLLPTFRKRRKKKASENF